MNLIWIFHLLGAFISGRIRGSEQRNETNVWDWIAIALRVASLVEYFQSIYFPPMIGNMFSPNGKYWLRFWITTDFHLPFSPIKYSILFYSEARDSTQNQLIRLFTLRDDFEITSSNLFYLFTAFIWIFQKNKFKSIFSPSHGFFWIFALLLLCSPILFAVNSKEGLKSKLDLFSFYIYSVVQRRSNGCSQRWLFVALARASICVLRDWILCVYALNVT